MRNIVLTCEDYLPSIGGAEICVQNLAQELRALGYLVTIFTNTEEVLPEDKEQNIIRVPWHFTPWFVYQNIVQLWKIIRKADLVHCQYSFRLACVCAIICRLTGKPMVLTQQGRGIVPEVNTQWMHRPFYKACQYISMYGANIITSTSKEITDLTAQFVSRKKIVDLTNGYNSHQFSADVQITEPKEYSALSDNTKIILSVRRLVPKNGIHILIQALAHLKKRYANFHYFAIGTGRMHQEIQELIHSLQLDDHVTLLGKKPNYELTAYYKHTNVIVVPSSAEATSITCIESMAMARPVVASRVGGLIDLLGSNNEYGTLVSIYDSEESNYDAPTTRTEKELEPLVQTLYDILTQPESYEKKAQIAAEYAHRTYSWEVITKQYIKLYDQLLLR